MSRRRIVVIDPLDSKFMRAGDVEAQAKAQRLTFAVISAIIGVAGIVIALILRS